MSDLQNAHVNGYRLALRDVAENAITEYIAACTGVKANDIDFSSIDETLKDIIWLLGGTVPEDL